MGALATHRVCLCRMPRFLGRPKGKQLQINLLLRPQTAGFEWLVTVITKTFGSDSDALLQRQK